MINDVPVLNHPGLVCVFFVPGLGRPNQVRAVPLCPIDEVVGAGKSVKGLRLPKSSEIEHDPDVADFGNLRVAGDTFEVVDYGLVAEALPVNHVV